MTLKPIKESITKDDMLKTIAKFKAWDKFVNGEIDEKYQLALLQDPTILAYAYLKDKANKNLKLRTFQDILINDKNQFIVCASANQVGKTWGACAKIIHHLLFVPNATVMVTSRNDDLSKKIVSQDIKEMCLRSNLQIQGETDNKRSFSIQNWDGKGISKIISVPPTESALSYDPTLLVIDEAGFIKDGIHLYDQVFEPRIGDTQTREHPFLTMGQIFVISNPNSTQGLLWKLWNDSRYSRYRFNWLVHPLHTTKQYKEIKDRVPADIFDSCYAAVFSSNTGRYIKGNWYENAVDDYDLIIPQSKTTYFGLDLTGENVKSRNTDCSVLYGVILLRSVGEEPRVKVVYRKQWKPNTRRKIIYREIKNLFNNCNFGGLAYDKMGVGDSVYYTLTDPSGDYRMPRYMVHPLTYSLPNKSSVYQNLKMLYEFNRITHPDIKNLRDQLATLDFEVTESGHLKIHHQRKSMKDDDPDALANACYEAVRLAKTKANIITV